MTVSRDSRRSALARLVIAGTGIVTAGLAGLVGLVAIPRASGPTKRWRKALSVFDLSSDAPTSAVIAERHADGWYETRKQSVVFIDKVEGQVPRAVRGLRASRLSRALGAVSPAIQVPVPRRRL